MLSLKLKIASSGEVYEITEISPEMTVDEFMSNFIEQLNLPSKSRDVFILSIDNIFPNGGTKLKDLISKNGTEVIVIYHPLAAG